MVYLAAPVDRRQTGARDRCVLPQVKGSPLALESELGSCLRPARRRASCVFSHLAQIKSTTSAPGSRCLLLLPSVPSQLSRTLPEAPRHLFTSLPPPPLLHLTSQPTRLCILLSTRQVPACFGKGHGASDPSPGVVVSLDRFMCDAPVLPAPFDEFQPGYNNIRLPATLPALTVWSYHHG